MHCSFIKILLKFSKGINEISKKLYSFNVRNLAQKIIFGIELDDVRGCLRLDKRKNLFFFKCVLFFVREDGSYKTKVQLPTRNPFFLLRFTSPCQMVQGMYVREESVKFDDEDRNNKNSVSGKYPMGASNGRNQRLLYCYYSPLG